MSILHTINKTPSSKLLESCLEVASDEDSLLFLEDGIYYARTEFKSIGCASKLTCYVLKEDLLARGGKLEASAEIEIVDYNGFVKLCEKSDKVINWF